MIINIGAVLATLRKFLGFEMTIAEWIGTAILAAIPYLVIGVIWSVTHTDHLVGTDRHRPHGVVPRIDRQLAGTAVLGCVHGMSDTRISVTRQTARWDPDAEVSVKEAMDFWSFAAAAANVVMQLASPGVGYGVVESKVDSGSILKHPWKRLRTTSQYLAVAVFGSEADRAAFREAVDGAHRQVISTPESPVKYNAFDRELQMWVAACLFVGLEDTYKLLARRDDTPNRPSSSTAPRGRWEPPCRSPRTSGPPPEPSSTPTGMTHADGWSSTLQSASTCLDLINLRMINPVLGLPFRPLLKFLTIGFLAPVFRDALGVRWSRGKQRRFEWLFLLVAFVEPVPAGVHPPGRQLHRPGRRAQAGPRAQQPGVTVTGLRRLLSRKVSIEAMIEIRDVDRDPLSRHRHRVDVLQCRRRRADRKPFGDTHSRWFRVGRVRRDDRAVAVSVIRPRGLCALTRSRP